MSQDGLSMEKGRVVLRMLFGPTWPWPTVSIPFSSIDHVMGLTMVFKRSPLGLKIRIVAVIPAFYCSEILLVAFTWCKHERELWYGRSLFSLLIVGCP